MNQNLKCKAASLLGLATLTTMTVFGQSGPISVNVNGQAISFPEAQPRMMGNYVMVPLRGVFEKLGATVDWFATDQKVVAHRGNTIVELKIDDNQATVKKNSNQIIRLPT